MIDFKKLMNETPEERAARHAHLEKLDRARIAREVSLIAERQQMVERIAAGGLDRLDENSRRFVRSLQTMSEIHHWSGLKGGDLAYLTAKQVGWLDRLDRQCHSAAGRPGFLSAAKRT